MRGEVILLVEDDADVAELFVVVLGRSGFTNEVVVACDEVETMDYLFGRGEHAGRDNTHTPGLFVLGLNMPRMGGLETLRRMRSYEETKLLPVVVMSASPSPRDKDEAHRLRANSFIGKTTSRIAYSELVPLFRDQYKWQACAHPVTRINHEDRGVPCGCSVECLGMCQ